MKIPTISLKADVDVVLWFNRFLLSVVDAWPVINNASYTSSLFRNFRIFIWLSCLANIIIASIMTIIMRWGDLDVLTEIGCVGAQMILVMVKYANMVFCRHSFAKIVESLRELWSVAQNQEERNTLVEYAYPVQIFTFAYYGLCLADLLTFTFAPILLTYLNYLHANGTEYHKVLPFDLWYGVDNQKSPNFEVIYGYQIIFTIFATFAVSGTDGTYPALAFHVAGQFKLIQLRFAAIGRKLKNDAQSGYNDVINDLGLCIKHHQRILSLANDLEEFLGPVIFMQLLLGALSICLTGYTLIDGRSTIANQCKYCSFMTTQLVQLAIYCWPGEAIITESQAVGECVYYMVPWMKLPLERQRDLILVSLRSQKQCQLTALGMQIACMSKITEVVKASGSYLAMLRSIRDK